MGKKVSKHMKVCSLHFKDSDFYLKDHINQRARLRKTAIPSQKIPIGSHDCQQRKDRAQRTQRSLHLSIVETDEPIYIKDSSTNKITTESKDAVNNLIYFNQNPAIFKKHYEDKAVQVDTFNEFMSYDIDNLIDTSYNCQLHQRAFTLKRLIRD
ncbi:hypothetical protein FQR65_LT15730 [Abscondita terminalis]|nr:hypothetical protein FQR65_LT15730 [Abscondita terminalis]